MELKLKKAFIFDLDNTLYSEIDYYYLVFKKFSIDKKINDKILIKNLEQIYFNNNGDIFGEVLKKSNLFCIEYKEYLFTLYKTIQCNISIYSEARNLIQLLDKRNKIKGIITNGTVEAQKNKIKNLKIAHNFDFIIFARKWGVDYEKPHPKSFDEALNLSDCLRSEAIFIGDNINTDIVGAKNSEIDYLYLNKNNNLVRKNQNILSINIINSLNDITENLYVD